MYIFYCSRPTVLSFPSSFSFTLHSTYFSENIFPTSSTTECPFLSLPMLDPPHHFLTSPYQVSDVPVLLFSSLSGGRYIISRLRVCPNPSPLFQPLFSIYFLPPPRTYSDLIFLISNNLTRARNCADKLTTSFFPSRPSSLTEPKLPACHHYSSPLPADSILHILANSFLSTDSFYIIKKSPVSIPLLFSPPTLRVYCCLPPFFLHSFTPLHRSPY